MKTLRLLMVEDSQDDVVLLVRALAKAGIEADPLRVDTAEGVVAALAAEPFDAVICDYVLPQLDAARALSLVRERAGTVPCIVLSGQLTPAAVETAKRGGAVACLEKDDVAGIIAALHRIGTPDNGSCGDLGRERHSAVNELNRFFALSLDCLCIADFTGHFRRTNVAFERTLGCGPGALLGRAFMDFVHPDDRVSTMAVMRQLRAGHSRVGFENRYRCADGTYRWLDWTAQPVVAEELIYAVARDVTERREMEAELRRTAQAVRDLYDRAPCGYHSLDAEGVFVEINDTELRWLGYRRDELIGRKSFQDLLTPDSVATFLENFPRFKETGEVRNLEFTIRRKDGRAMPVLVSATAVHDEQGNYVMSRSTLIDISARKEAERRVHDLNEVLVRRTAELESVNNELEAFSYSASHDLRAPLRAVEGFTSILIDDWPPADLEAAQGHLERVRSAARKMRALIDDLLKLSQVGSSALKMELVDLSELAGEVIAEVRARDPERLVEMKLAPGIVAWGDRRALRLVLENLLENAWKFTRRQPAACIEFDARDHDGERHYCVRDNGAGFDNAYAGKLFIAFQRLHMVTDFEGTGIGLTIVRRIIHLHGGRVWAEGAVERGAAFTFTLPIPP